MKILHMSDTHGLHGKLGNLPYADVVVHSGDLSFSGSVYEAEDFIRWFSSLPYRHKVFIAGNHDSCFCDAEVTGLPDNVHYLCNSSVIIEGVKLYGMPMFMEDLADGSYDRNIRAIPEDTDVLITHQPPYKILDFSENRHYGDKGIWKRVMEVVPRFHLFGHIHNAYNMYTFKQVAFSNASLVDNDYELCREPRLLEVTEK